MNGSPYDPLAHTAVSCELRAACGVAGNGAFPGPHSITLKKK